MTLVILVPSRGRPDRLNNLVNAVARTATGAVRILVGLDEDDPAVDRYADVLRSFDYDDPRDGIVADVVARRRTLSAWTNFLAAVALERWPDTRFLGSMGDDHMPRSRGWDEALTGACRDLDGPGWAYPNDLLQGPRLATAWVEAVEVYEALGWVMEPSLDHMFVDNVVMQLGEDTDRLAYVPSAIVEHQHPAAGKAAVDPSYKETNAAPAMARDRGRFEAWRTERRAADAYLVTQTGWKD